MQTKSAIDVGKVCRVHVCEGLCSRAFACVEWECVHAKGRECLNWLFTSCLRDVVLRAFLEGIGQMCTWWSFASLAVFDVVALAVHGGAEMAR